MKDPPVLTRLLQVTVRWPEPGLDEPSGCLNETTHRPCLKTADAFKRQSDAPNGTNSQSWTTLVLAPPFGKSGGGFDSGPRGLETKPTFPPLFAYRSGYYGSSTHPTSSLVDRLARFLHTILHSGCAASTVPLKLCALFSCCRHRRLLCPGIVDCDINLGPFDET